MRDCAWNELNENQVVTVDNEATIKVKNRVHHLSTSSLLTQAWPSPPHAPFIQLWDTHSPDGYPIANFTEHSLEVTMLAPLSRAWGTISQEPCVCHARLS